jgi:hypothetical protein
MPDLTDLPVLDVAIGLAFMYFLLSIVCSSVQEAIASVLKLRARNLETGIRSLLTDKTTADNFFENWRIEALKTPRWLRKRKGSRKPSYIPSRTFALTLIDTLTPAEDDGSATDDSNLLRKAKAAIDEMDDGVGKRLLLDAHKRSGDQLNVFRGEIEDAFNSTMDRATGWYKRKVQIVLFVIALIVAGALNADTFNVGQRLFKDDALRAQVVRQAVKAADAGNAPTSEEKAAKAVENQIKRARATALPLGWVTENSPHKPSEESWWGSWNWLSWLAKAGGILLTAFALTLGAPFWFDVLGRFARLRSSGNRIGTPKDDETAPVDRDERLKAGTSAGSAPPPPIADAEREKNAKRARGVTSTGPEPQQLHITVATAPPRRRRLGGE